jgi:hypothetical protein
MCVDLGYELEPGVTENFFSVKHSLGQAEL